MLLATGPTIDEVNLTSSCLSFQYIASHTNFIYMARKLTKVPPGITYSLMCVLYPCHFISISPRSLSVPPKHLALPSQQPAHANDARSSRIFYSRPPFFLTPSPRRGRFHFHGYTHTPYPPSLHLHLPAPPPAPRLESQSVP